MARKELSHIQSYLKKINETAYTAASAPKGNAIDPQHSEAIKELSRDIEQEKTAVEEVG